MTMFKILIAEDESIISRDICRVIEKIEHTTAFQADHYDAAVEIIDREIPDLALLDIKLYEENEAGLRIARYINSKYRIPIIFLSGYATDNYLQKARKEMPVTFITKPVDHKQLQAALLMAMQETNASKLRHLLFHGRFLDGIDEEEINKKKIDETPLSHEKVSPESILLIKSFNHIKRNNIMIKLTGKRYLLCSLSIQQALEMLPGNFVKVHSAYIINKDHVTGLIGSSHVKVGDELIHFGTEFRKKKEFRLFRDF